MAYIGALRSLAEESSQEFLAKATGNAVQWVQMPGMKPGFDSIGQISICHGLTGVASHGCGVVSLNPPTVVQILKDRPSWFRDCRALSRLKSISLGTDGIIEVLYMQLYAPTCLAPARDFWFLRYTFPMNDGSLVICERSLNNIPSCPNMPPVPNFVRAEIFASGYLIKPCEGGGSIIYMVDHMDLQSSSVPEVVSPLYESSIYLAQKTTIPALRHLGKMSEEHSQTHIAGWNLRPAELWGLSQRMCKGFNEAVNGFVDEEWSLIQSDDIDQVDVYVNSSPSFLPVSNAVLCAKASMILLDVPPALLLRFIRENRSEWADSGIEAYSAAAIKAVPCSIPSLGVGTFGTQVITPIYHTIGNEEFLEVIKLVNMSLYQDTMQGDFFILQLCSGVDEDTSFPCSELVFAPTDPFFSADGPLLPSGFRIFPVNFNGDPSTPKSVLTMAFQFAFQMHLQESVVAMARQYIRSVISSVHKVVLAISAPHPASHSGLLPPPGTSTTVETPLAHWICESYSFILGLELLQPGIRMTESIPERLWHHTDPVICFSIMAPLKVLTYANQAGLAMLETNEDAIQAIPLENIFGGYTRDKLFSMLPQTM